MTNNWQAFFNSRTLFWGFGISLILNQSNTSFWLCELVGMVVGFLIILLVKKTNDSKIIKAICGFVMSFLATIILVNMGGTLYLRETPIFILALLPIISGFIMSRSGISSLKKTLSLLFIFSIFMNLTEGGMLITKAHAENILPFIFGTKGFFSGATIFTLASITPVLCLNDVSDKKNVLINYALSCITIFMISCLIVFVLGNKEAMLYRYPEYVVLKRIKFLEFFSNMDNIFVIAMIVDLLVTIASGLKNIEVNGKITRYIAPVLLMVAVLFACPSSKIMTLLYTNFPFILIFLLILTLLPKRSMNKS